ncbi:MAG: caspase family protein [Bacteroidetes bacterium]|nr:caspase family protein [Bacteroidota bacterium]MBS1930292.1 caspase family protein [Bacteroidota bacterium]
MKWICFFVWLSFFYAPLFSQKQRALIIGIDQYTPPTGYTPSTSAGRMDYRNLQGCRNDASAIYSIITSKFGFETKNIDTLFDNSATRDGILSAMNKLLASSSAGDIAFIYYAGHGSEVKNSLSFELDKKDQTIVPANAWQEGVRDIRDKELSRIFNDFINKKIKLTVIFDCCHSGSISRGPNASPDAVRYMPMANWDSKDASMYDIPEKRKGDDFLIFSAAQSDENAAEQIDDQGIHHGAFTLALTQALNQQSVDASALDIFISARAILKSNGKNQEPVIGGSAVRQQETLFGIKKGKLSDFSFVAVSGIIRNQVQLQAGFALGLAKDNELSMINENKDTIFQIRIDTVLGVTKSLASLIKGDIKNIKPGFQFRVTNWVSSGRPLIKIYIPKTELTDAEILKFTSITKELKNSTKIKWIPFIGKGEKAPYTSVFWINNTCFLKTDTAAAVRLNDITAASILKFCKKDSTLYVELPLSKENSTEYYNRLQKNKSLQLVESINNSNYTLFGRLGRNGFPAYGFRKTQVAAGDSLESMPVETDCFEISGNKETSNRNIADSLFEIALKLSKIKGWLNITGPDGTKKEFPYHLEMYNEDKKQTITDGHYHIGENVSLKMVVNEDYFKDLTMPKFVYIFAVDQSGTMQLYYPGEDGNVENKFPKFENNNIIKEVPIISYTIPAPSGTDNFFLLASDEPIPNASMILNQEGVYSGIASRGLRNESNPLSDLLDMGNAGSRGVPKKLPATWSIQKFTFRCTY